MAAENLTLSDMPFEMSAFLRSAVAVAVPETGSSIWCIF